MVATWLLINTGGSVHFSYSYVVNDLGNKPFRGVLRKRCSEIMQQIYRRTPMPKCDFSKVAFRHGSFFVNLLHIFRTTFLTGGLSGLEQFFAGERAFFHLKSSFRSQFI